MIRLRAPGRICLFGEHQDYLNFPVMAMAISKYIYLEAERILESKFLIDMPDISQQLEIKLNKKELEYQSKRDYIRSGYNQFLRKGAGFDKGYKITITGDIPINAGVASSSALVMVWLLFLKIISNKKIKAFQLAIDGYNTEVKEFKEGGGMMDHFASTFGNLIYLKPILAKPDLIHYKVKLNGFILGNSMEKKETVDDLIRVKNASLNAFKELKNLMPNFNQYTTNLEEIEPFLHNLKKEYQKKILGNIHNRNYTIKAKELIERNRNILLKEEYSKKTLKFYKSLAILLDLHQKQLKENIKVSTRKIDNILLKCKSSGALGGKINGSGFGGTLFALSPGNEEEIKNVIEEAGGEAFIIKTSNGAEYF